MSEIEEQDSEAKRYFYPQIKVEWAELIAAMFHVEHFAKNQSAMRLCGDKIEKILRKIL